jgi:hypothetical protein
MKSSFVIFILLFSFNSFSQVVNGSFENGTLADLSNWEWTCGAQSFANAPPIGGNWCIEVVGGNLQGCFPGYAYQKLPTILNGQTFLLSGWAKALTAPYIGIYFGKINNGTIILQAGDTTSSTTWIALNKLDSFSLLPGDTAVVVLFGGLTTGPVLCYGYFDQINLQFVTALSALVHQQSFSITPNPFSYQTQLTTSTYSTNATLSFYNFFGKKIREIRNLSGQAFDIKRDALPNGIYWIRLIEDGKLLVSTKIYILD